MLPSSFPAPHFSVIRKGLSGQFTFLFTLKGSQVYVGKDLQDLWVQEISVNPAFPSPPLKHIPHCFIFMSGINTSLGSLFQEMFPNVQFKTHHYSLFTPGKGFIRFGWRHFLQSQGWSFHWIYWKNPTTLEPNNCGTLSVSGCPFPDKISLRRLCCGLGIVLPNLAFPLKLIRSHTPFSHSLLLLPTPAVG